MLTSYVGASRRNNLPLGMLSHAHLRPAHEASSEGTSGGSISAGTLWCRDPDRRHALEVTRPEFYVVQYERGMDDGTEGGQETTGRVAWRISRTGCEGLDKDCSQSLCHACMSFRFGLIESEASTVPARTGLIYHLDKPVLRCRQQVRIGPVLLARSSARLGAKFFMHMQDCGPSTHPPCRSMEGPILFRACQRG
jgi:hypothetical protein